jgi:hypothetical protein
MIAIVDKMLVQTPGCKLTFVIDDIFRYHFDWYVWCCFASSLLGLPLVLSDISGALWIAIDRCAVSNTQRVAAHFRWPYYVHAIAVFDAITDLDIQNTFHKFLGSSWRHKSTNTSPLVH